MAAIFQLRKSGRRQIFVGREQCKHTNKCFMAVVVQRQIKWCNLNHIPPLPLQFRFDCISILPRMVLAYLQKTDQLWLHTNLFLIYLASTIATAGLDERPIHFVYMHWFSVARYRLQAHLAFNHTMFEISAELCSDTHCGLCSLVQ
jgi:hypothetical protein